MRSAIIAATAILVLVLNVAVLLVAFGDVFVSHVPLPQMVPDCARCNEPDIQRALQFVHASARGAIAERLVGMWPMWLALFVVNVGSPILTWKIGKGHRAA